MRLLYDARLAARGLGISTFIGQLAEALVDTGEIELVWLGDPELAPRGTSSALRMARSPYPLLDGAAGRALARRLGADLVHFTGNTGWRCPGPVASVLSVHDLIFLHTGIRSRSPRQIVGHRYERMTVPRAVATADVLVVPSQTVAAQVVERLRPPRPPWVVNYGVHRQHQSPSVDSQEQETPLPAEPPYVVAFAGRDPRKQTSAVVSAWRELKDTGLRLHLLASGGMPPGLSESLAPELASGLVLVSPHLPRPELDALLQRATALIYPSCEEGFGLPVLEGMAAGIPVLSGAAPATREIGGDAIVPLDPNNLVGSIAAGLRRLIDDPALAAEIGLRGRAHASRFTWQAAAVGYLEAYHEAIERRR